MTNNKLPFPFLDVRVKTLACYWRKPGMIMDTFKGYEMPFISIHRGYLNLNPLLLLLIG